MASVPAGVLVRYLAHHAQTEDIYSLRPIIAEKVKILFVCLPIAPQSGELSYF